MNQNTWYIACITNLRSRKIFFCGIKSWYEKKFVELENKIISVHFFDEIIDWIMWFIKDELQKLGAKDGLIILHYSI